VRTHIRNAVQRLGAHSRTHAVVLALRTGELDALREL
jgi:DNA-binding CsgD family transcriptional regulator